MATDRIEFGLLKISGKDAKTLLQGQLTCNVEELVTQQRQLAALCNPQGRVISLFHLFKQNDDFFLLMQRDMLPITLAALKKYAVFYKVEMLDASNELATLPLGVELSAMHQQFISAGIPTLYPETSGKFLPHDLNLHLLSAISFDKGCYTGQEIIARMHYRGKLKNHLYKARINSTTAPTPGAPIYINDKGNIELCGTVVDAYPEPNQPAAYFLLILCPENHAQQAHLFIQNREQDYIIIE